MDDLRVEPATVAEPRPPHESRDGAAMLGTFLRFELRSRMRQPAVYVFSFVFALATYFVMATDAVALTGAVGPTAINSPFVITRTLAFLSVLSVVLVTAFVSTAVVRDFELSTSELFFTKPVRTLDLLTGRFLGAVAVAFLVMIGAAVGILLGTLMPWLDPARLVAFSLAPYAYALVVFVLPNLLVMGSFFFAVATLTRRVLLAHVSVLAFFVAYVVAEQLIADLDSDVLAALLDPFGMSALRIATRYWTVAERNAELVPLGSMLVLNRVVWLSLAAACFGLVVRRFSFSSRARRPWRGGEGLGDEASRTGTPLVVVTPRFGLGTTLAQLLRSLRADLGLVLRGKAFIMVMLFGMFMVYSAMLGEMEHLFGTPVLPVTYIMVRAVGMMLELFLMVTVTFYAGELVYVERQARMHELHDALPVPSWVPLVSKVAALWVAVLVLLGLGGLVGIGIQLSEGYTRFELLLYAKGLGGLLLSQWALVCVLAVVLQVVAGQKYLGFFLMLLYFVSQEVMVALGLEHGLVRFAFSPEATYSDMNGYGHFMRAMLWYRLYWGLWAAALLVVASLVWVRGTQTRLRSRLREARRRATRRHGTLLGALVLGIVGVGAFILYNTTVLNRYRTQDDRDDAAVRYEQAYEAEWDGAPQPRVVAVELEVDIFPRERELALRGVLTLVNEHDAAIDRLLVTTDPVLTVESLGLPDEALLEHDEELAVRIYRLEPALAPGAELRLPFALRFAEPGFVNHGSSTAVVHNGSFFHMGFVPYLGYRPDAELTDRNARRKRGLPEREGLRPPTDLAARANTRITRQSDWIRFAATVSTSEDQIALAPGYLTKEWVEGDRRYFRYEMDAPILDFYAFLSADYVVARDRWNDVAIEVYHHAPHAMNVPRMIEAVKASLDYYTVEFSPYQYRQVRIAEFPRYLGIAVSHPNTIPYSESIGFIADLRDEDRIDYVFYVTAHEVAHQWWGHQVAAAEVQGCTVLVETLSQYSALMVMEKEYGRTKMKRLLAYELDRYLQGRAAELDREVPLAFVEDHPYVHYSKGSLVMYALREVMGEAALNGVLKQYVADVAFQEPPFTTSLELVERIRAAMPERFAYLVEDLFETITLYDNRTIEATATPLEGGRFRVDLVIESHKLRADGEGHEREIPIADWLPIGVMGEDEEAEPLYLEWHEITGERTELSIEVTGTPVTAGIDPRVLFIDRERHDNVRVVDLRE